MTDENWRPVRPLGIWTRKSGEKTVLEGYIDVYETNHVGAYIWSLCGDGLTVDDIGGLVAERYGITVERATTATYRFLDELHARGFVQKEPISVTTD
ncbi:PqqD family protein [Streptomyces sp. NPDC059168]|uniref:PqqD family protein n=1 Tax=Streptomyces sp. NPDC059168 TaxID=3346753 RepID=UPI0036A5BD02